MSEIFSTLKKRNFVSLRSHVISSIYVELFTLAWVEISLPLCTIYMTKLFLTVVSQAVQGMWKQTGGYRWLRGKWFKSSKFTRTFE